MGSDFAGWFRVGQVARKSQLFINAGRSEKQVMNPPFEGRFFRIPRIDEQVGIVTDHAVNNNVRRRLLIRVGG